MRRKIHAFDRVVGGWVERLPRWLLPIMEFFTLLGQPPITVGLSAAVFGYGLALDKEFYLMSGIVALVTITFVSLIKIPVRRARPSSAYVEKMLFKTYSFPSGHAAGAFVSFGLTALAITYRWPEFALVAWLIAGISIFLVSLSRIYLGAHYASDIVGGWIVGGVGMLAILLLEK